MEAGARGYAVVEAEKGSDYQLVGALSQEEVPPPDAVEGEVYPMLNKLHLALVDNSDQHIVAEQDLYYEILEETYEILPLLVFNMVANIPLSKVRDDDAWRNKWVYITAGVFWSPRLYFGAARASNPVQFGAGLAVELQFLNFMSVEAGIEYSEDYVGIDESVNFKSAVLTVPVLLKFPLKPGYHFMIEPYGGITINTSSNTETQPPLLAWCVGINYGIRAGGGAVFIDARFAADLGESYVDRKTYPGVQPYQRYIINVGVGYKYGFFLRPPKKSSFGGVE
jgi:hypothetical protein